MPDFNNLIMSQIQVNGMDYDICDLEGRLKLEDLENAISTNQKILGEQGTAYAIYDSDTNTLTFFRANETYTSSDTSATDIMGNTYIGTIYTDIEDYTTAPAPWDDVKENINKVVIANNQYIIPKSCAGWFSDTSVEEFENISQLDLKHTTDLSYMFAGCTKLTTLPDLSEWDTSNVTNMEHMFEECVAANYKSIAKWDTSNVTNMNNMFNGSNFYSDNEPYLLDWDTSSVTDFSYMFANYEGSGIYKMSKFDTSAAQNMAGMFQNCPNATYVSLGQHWDTSNVTNMDNMFNNCPNLVKDCSSWNVSKVTSHIDFAEDSPNVIEPDWPVKSAPLVNGRAFRTALANLVGEEVVENEMYNWGGLGWGIEEVSSNLKEIRQEESDDTSGTLISDPNSSDPAVYLKFDNATGIATIVSSANRLILPEDCSGMFSYCEYITSLPDMNNWDTSNVTNMNYMFGGCSNAAFNPDISNWDTSSVTNMYFMFSNCSGAAFNPDVSNWNTSNVTNMSCMFYYCSGEAFNPNVSNWNTSSVTTMEQMFMGCSGAAFNPDVSNWDTSNVTNMNFMFASCSGEVFNPNVSNWNTSSVTTMGNMFWNCSGAAFNPNVSNWNTSNVTGMGGMFRDCNGAAFSPNVSNWNTSNVTSMSGMFRDCSGVAFTNLNVTSWDVSKVEYMDEMFNNCSNLTTIYATPDTDWRVSTNGAYSEEMFENCSKLKGGNGTTHTFSYTNNFYARIDKDGQPGYFTVDPSRKGTAYAILDSDGTLTFFRSENEYTAGTDQTVTDIEGNNYTGQVFTGVETNTGTSYSSAPWYSKYTSVKLARVANGQVIAPKSCAGWFYKCSNMTAFEGAERLDTSAVTSMYYMFSDCSAMVEPPAVGNWDTSAVTNMNYMFSGCSAMIEPPSVGNWNTSEVTSMSYMFQKCSSMTKPPAVDSWDTSKVNSMSRMFYNCRSIIEPPAVGNWDTSAVTNMQEMFTSCSSMTEPPAVGDWDTSAVTHMSTMFSACRSIIEPPAVGNWDTSAVTNIDNIFNNCSKMTEPPSVSNWNTGAVTSMSSMFYGCEAMMDPPAVGNWNTGAVTSTYCMFKDCSAMTEPPAVGNWDTSAMTNMGYMFQNCLTMTSLDVSGWDFSKIGGSLNYLGLQSCSNLRELKVPTRAKITGLPKLNEQNEYTVTWGNAERGISGLTAASMMSTISAGRGAGTWSWEIALPINRGGTGATTAVGAAKNIVDGNAIAPANITATEAITSGADITAGGEFKVDADFDSNASSVSTRTYRDLVKSFDNQDIQYAAVSSWKETDGSDGLTLVLHRVIDGVDKFNQLGVIMKNDGTVCYRVSDPRALAIAAQPDITLTTSQWVKGSRAYGQYFSVDIPCIAQPQSVTCTNSAMYVHGSGWQSITYRDWVWFGNMLYVRFDEISAMTEGLMFLVRMDLTVSFEHM